MEKIAVLGSTGSIGVNALTVIAGFNKRFKVVALSADSNVRALSCQAHRFRPRIVCVGHDDLVKEARALVPSGTKVVCGDEGLRQITSSDGVDKVIFAVAGSACIFPLIEAIKKRKAIALANKEALVAAGQIIMKLARQKNVKIVPIDSEHSAVFQCLDGRNAGALARICLTGSGGPLLGIAKDRFDKMSRGYILKHPKWSMGRKISVDSATMMNKGLEIIEAMRLFDVGEDKIDVLIHPEAIVHSLVEFIDGTVLAQLGLPDMRLPIQYALTYPERCEGLVKKVDLACAGRLTFFKPDLGKFPCLELARQAARDGGTAPAVLSAADEEAVRLFLEGRIRFSEIPHIVENVLERHRGKAGSGLTMDDILESGKWARAEARAICCH
jgi:1-deoxy-D-xylulose-5-phosphate reductoisomerase